MSPRDVAQERAGLGARERQVRRLEDRYVGAGGHCCGRQEGGRTSRRDEMEVRWGSLDQLFQLSDELWIGHRTEVVHDNDALVGERKFAEELADQVVNQDGARHV